jgi:hypothetical protein
MKTEDELDAEIAKLFDEVTTTKVEMVNGKPRVTDEQTIAEMDFAEACDDYVRAARCRRRFRRGRREFWRRRERSERRLGRNETGWLPGPWEFQAAIHSRAKAVVSASVVMR